MTRFSIHTGLVQSEDYQDLLEGFDRAAALKFVEEATQYQPYVLGGEGEGYLHFAGVRIFDRGEDADKGQQVVVFGDQIDITENIEGNPSVRRGAVSLYFYSETGPNLIVHFIQHKGQTYVEFYPWDGEKPVVEK